MKTPEGWLQTDHKKIQKDAQAIARLLNLTRRANLHDHDLLKGQLGMFALMDGVFSSEGNSRWYIHGDTLISVLNWNSETFPWGVITATVKYDNVLGGFVSS